ncbi:MAG: hypothetical protein COA86_09105 [Kangiella sp.]|nr:MAG: hypothetical protein COB38_05060 [Gammaproteobacteria bacterium]PHS18287.1 MAG: hypothetical protein COA86_09105 [Kangiella sp.]
MSKGNILIVDDSPNHSNLLKAMVEEEYNVQIVNSGQACLDSVAKLKPDVVLLDVQMPEMSGYEVCNHLREKEETKTLPVIFVSSMLSSEDRDIGFDVGANEYINKPVIQKELLNKIAYQLSIIRMG